MTEAEKNVTAEQQGASAPPPALTMKNYFYLRPEFESFSFIPERDSEFLFGDKDQKIAQSLLELIEGCGYSMEGPKGVLFGDYGRGKTHLWKYLCHQIPKQNLPFRPYYCKLSAYKKKEPVSSFVAALIGALGSDLKAVFKLYCDKITDRTSKPVTGVHSDLARIADEVNHWVEDPVKCNQVIQYLSGEKVGGRDALSNTSKPQLTTTVEFGDVFRLIADLFLQVHTKLPLFLVDEVEYLKPVSDPDTFYSWVATFRELTENQHLGMLFCVGAVEQEALPDILMMPEIVRRIGTTNFLEFYFQSETEIRDFLVEFLGTLIAKGPVPQRHVDVFDSLPSDVVPAELQTLTGGDAEQLKAFPFEPSALDHLCQLLQAGGGTNKPSEALSRLQKLTQMAMRNRTKIITIDMVDELDDGGLTTF